MMRRMERAQKNDNPPMLCWCLVPRGRRVIVLGFFDLNRARASCEGTTTMRNRDAASTELQEMAPASP
ncbi:hypothetical protein PVAP13_6KG173705 [Panicum virgatum]|uniref:Uncharacterized protein n=1 Tax=Panicum virgatum TaxID=38727 RepID=A0A8T0R751_PANVG|nr:hypothetical protein PVAP13_6KG173705 [Panicum virgatum]